MSHIVGIDLGTTNSLCSVFLAEQQRLIPNSLGRMLTPSVIGLLEDGQILVGAARSCPQQSSPNHSGMPQAPSNHSTNGMRGPMGILRGVRLAGIDSAQCPRESRLQIWQRLATDWSLDQLDLLTRKNLFNRSPSEAADMLAGKTSGRTRVRIASQP